MCRNYADLLRGLSILLVGVVQVSARGPNFTEVRTAQDLYLSWRLVEPWTDLNDTDRFRSESSELSFTRKYEGVNNVGAPWSLEASAELSQSVDTIVTADRLDVRATLRSELSLAESGVDTEYDPYLHADSSPDDSAPVIYREGNRIDVYFTSEYYLTYDLDLSFLENSGCEARVYLMRARWYLDDLGIETYGYLPFGDHSPSHVGIEEDYDSDGAVRDGDYLLRILLLATGNDVGEVSVDFTAHIDFSDPLLTEQPPGGFTHPDVGDEVEAPEELSLSNIAIVSETDNADGTTDLAVTADVVNGGPRSWNDVRLHLTSAVVGDPILEEVAHTAYELIGPEAIVSPVDDDSLVVRVDNADLPAARVQILSGERFYISGLRLAGFRYPPYPFSISVPRSIITEDGNLIYLMTPHSLRSGVDFERATYLVANHPVYVTVEDFGFPILYNPFVRMLPFLIDYIPENDIFDYEPYGGQVVPMHEYLVDGRFETAIPPAEAYYPGGETADATGPDTGGDFPDKSPGYPVPMVVNQIKLNEWVEFSGSYYLRPGSFAMVVEKNEDSPEMEFTVRGEVVLDVNFLLEISAPLNNTDEPLAEREAQLFKFDLFTVALPNGFTLTPEFAMYLRAGVDASAALTVPFETQIKLSFEGGVRDGDPVLEANAEIVELPVTNLTLQDEITASVYLENEFELFLALQPPDLGLSAVGPTFSSHAIIDLTVDTSTSPIWSFDANLELRAGLDIQLQDEVSEVFNVDIEVPEATLATFPLFSRDWDPPETMASSVRMNSFTTFDAEEPWQPGFVPLQGDDLRWARVLSPLEVDRSSDFHFIHPLVGTSDYLVGDGATFSRMTENGALKWTRQHPLFTPIAAVAEPDGGFTVLNGRLNRIEVARYDAVGDLVWHRAHVGEESLNFSNFDLVRRDDGENGSTYFVLSRFTYLGQSNRHPALGRLNDAGDLERFEVYALDTPDPNTEPRRMAVGADGNLVIAGTTDADLETSDLFINITKNYFAAKIDADDGSVLWSNVYGSLRSPALTSIEAEPSGNFYFGGTIGVVVGDPFPSILLGQVSGAGEWTDGILFGPAEEGLRTPYDVINDLVWIDGDLWVAGSIGASSGITDTASAFTARITDRFAVTRMSLFAGPEDDAFHALTPATNGSGLMVVGSSDSFLPWPTGETDELARLVVKLPWEGILRFHPLSAGGQNPLDLAGYTAGTQFVEPRIQPLAALAEIVGGQTAVPLIRETIPFVETTGFAPEAIETDQFIAVESVDRDAFSSDEDFFAWAKVDPQADTDGDGLSNQMEHWWGTDMLYTQDSPPLMEIHYRVDAEIPHLALSMLRAATAEFFGPTLESSVDLEIWESFSDFTFSLDPIDAEWNELRLEIPLSAVSSDLEFMFFRMRPPNAP